MSMPGGRPEPRIGDREREAAVTALGEHYAAGRITKDEFDERCSTAWEARTASGLAPLFADLPLPHGVPGGWSPPYGGPPGFRPRGPVPPGYPVAPQPARRPARPRFPWGALLVALLVLTVVTNVPWIVIGLVVWAVVAWGGGCGGRRRHGGQASGSRRDWRGSWS